MSHGPTNTVVLEATSLIALFKKDDQLNLNKVFDTIKTKFNAEDLCISDMVFFEVTGFRPAFQPELISILDKASEQGEDAFKSAINKLAQLSPRGGDAKRQYQVASLLQYIQNNPDALIKTSIGARYEQLLSAEHDMQLGKTNEHYCLSQDDVKSVLGNWFDNSAIKVDADDLYMWGIRNEEDTRKIHEKKVAATRAVDYHRIVKVGQYTTLNELKDVLPEERKNTPLTYGDLADNPSLRVPLAGGQGSVPSLDEVLHANKMCMRDYFDSGLLPATHMVDIAVSLGFTQGQEELLEAGSKRHITAEKELEKRGFTSHIPTITELKSIELAYHNQPDFKNFQRLINHDNIEVIAQHKRTKFDRNISSQGIKAERIITQGLISGVIDPTSWVEIASQSGALKAESSRVDHSAHPDTHGEAFSVTTYKLANGLLSQDIILEISKNDQGQVAADKSFFYTPASGFKARDKSEHLTPHIGVQVNVRGKAMYKQSFADALAYAGSNQWPEKEQFKGLLDTIMVPAASQSASNLFAVAKNIIGEAQFNQLELGEANHMKNRRRDTGRGSYWQDAMVTLNGFSRQLGFHAGEIATAEAGATLAQHRGVSYICNHDGGLKPRHFSEDAPRSGYTQIQAYPVQISDATWRQRPQLRTELTDIEQKLSEADNVRMVSTATLFSLLGVKLGAEESRRMGGSSPRAAGR